MFDFVREHTRLALGFMLLLIIPSFIFFGVQGYSRFTDGSNTTVAKVDGQSISRNEWDDASKRYVDQVRRQSPNTDIAQIDTPQLRRDALDGLVRDRLLIAAANQLQLYPTVGRMARLFDSDPQFAGLRGPDGKINRELLAMQGMSPEVFDQRLRQDLATRQVLAGVTQTAPVPAMAASAALDAYFQRREVQLQRFEPAAYRSKVSPTDAEVEAYYKANEALFRAPEQATIDYVVLDLDTLAKGVALTDAEVRKAYDDGIAKYTVPEERRASHILIKAEKEAPAAEREKAKAKAQALLAEVRKNPALFAELARKNSDDPGSAAKGGDLDFFGRGAMVKPFEDAVFKLKPGEISDVVPTDFGYHVIMLTAVRGGQSKPLDEVRGEIEAELRKAQAQRRWAESAELFTNTVYEQSDSLKPVIDKLKLDKKTATVQRTAPAAAVAAKSPLASAKFLDAVFGTDSLRNKRNTDAVEVGPNQLIAAHVLQYQPARIVPFAEVKDAARERLIDIQAAALARKDGEARVAELRSNPGEALPNTLTVSRSNAQGLPKALLDPLMRADASKLPTVLGLDLPGQGYVVMRLTQVLPREAIPGGDEPLRAQYAQAWAAAEADAYLAALKKRYKVEIKPAADLPAEAASAPAR
jgi:peptidyl-prolyl cis-trans isomerase D